MAYNTLKKIEESSKRYVGRVVSKSRTFCPGNFFFLEVEDRTTGEIRRKKVAKSSMYRKGLSPHREARYPIFNSLNFTEKGLELSVQMVDTLLGAHPKKSVFLPREKFS